MKSVIRFITFAMLCLSQAFSQGLIIDHRCTDLSAIPANWIDSAKTKLKVTYQHTSHGSQLVSGLRAIAATDGGVYNFTSSYWGLFPGVFLNDYGMPGAKDLGHNGDLAWQKATTDVLNDPNCDRNVVIWSWCGGVSDNDSTGIYAYLNAMSSLETSYPNIKFVYMTGHLDGSGENGNLNLMNNLIRNYCNTNNKILFDFADIESYAPGDPQNYMIWCGLDGLNYDSTCTNPWEGPNWGAEWVAQHPSHPYVGIINNCTECAHSDDVAEAKLNCVLKGNAFWWLLARLAGWEPSTGIIEANKYAPSEHSLSQNYPNPFNPSTVIGFQLSVNSRVTLKVFDVLGREVATLVDGELNAGEHSVIFEAKFYPAGIYFYRLQPGSICSTKKMELVR